MIPRPQLLLTVAILYALVASGTVCGPELRKFVKKTNSLALYLPLDDGGNTLNDKSGNNRDGTDSGTSKSTSLLPSGRGASRTNFKNQKGIDVAGWAKPVSAWAMCAFVRVTVAPSSNTFPVLSDYYSGTVSRAMYVDSSLHIVVYRSGGGSTTHTTVTLVVATIYFVCAGFDGSTGQTDVFLYQAGQNRIKSSLGGATETSSATVSNTFSLGRDGLTTTIAPAQFDLDEVIVWDSYGSKWESYFDRIWSAAAGRTCTVTRTMTDTPALAAAATPNPPAPAPAATPIQPSPAPIGAPDPPSPAPAATSTPPSLPVDATSDPVSLPPGATPAPPSPAPATPLGPPSPSPIATLDPVSPPPIATPDPTAAPEPSSPAPGGTPGPQSTTPVAMPNPPSSVPSATHDPPSPASVATPDPPAPSPTARTPKPPSPPASSRGPPPLTLAPTLEPTLPPLPEVASLRGTLTLQLDAVVVRRRASELQAAIAEAARVELSAVRIISILPGSTVVQFEIITQQSAADVSASLVHASAASSNLQLASFAPVVESLTLRARTTSLEFGIGVAFWVCVGLAAVGAIGAIAWQVYRWRHPEPRMKLNPVARMRGGVLRVRVQADDDELPPDDSDATDWFALGPSGPVKIEDVVRIPASSVRKVSLDAAYLGVEATPARESAGKSPRRRWKDSYATRRSNHRGERSVAEAAPEPSFDDAVLVHRPVRVNRFSQLQPSREVVNGNLAASYAVE